MNSLRTLSLSSCVLAATILSGCAGLPFIGDNASSSGAARKTDAAPSRSQTALREGISLYNEGNFNGAIKRLAAADVAGTPVATRTAALKYTAFSYCVTSRPAQCRQAFDKALRLDPRFDLGPGEHSHPLWGPVFTKAKKEA